MNQFKWTYVGGDKQHHIGIFHGAKTGHLVIYCNAKIMIIDFNILESKTYSFFIEEELCEISIERKDGQFFYGFEINKEADTPRNRLRKKMNKRHMWQALAFFAVLFLFIAGFIAIIASYNTNKQQQKAIFTSNSKTTYAKVFPKATTNTFAYAYVADGQVLEYENTEESDKDAVRFLQKGMPIEKGDEFKILYLPNNPKIHKIHYNEPSELQIERYIQRALAKEIAHNQNVDPAYAECKIRLAYEQKGITGIALFYHQKTAPHLNKHYNENTYKRLIRDIDFRRRVRHNCEK